MKRLFVLAVGLFLFSVLGAGADTPRFWYVTSPNHGQTFAYGSQTYRAWSSRGNPRHLLFFSTYTNDPYVDQANPRQYDYFSFDFPSVKLQSDGRTFAYRAPDGHVIPVARRSPGFLGIDEIKLLPTSRLVTRKPHGYLTVMLLIVE